MGANIMNCFKKILQALILMVVLMLMVQPTAFAKDINIAWDTNQDADYYIVHYGEQPGTYTAQSENITATTYTIKNPENKIYYMAVKAYNNCGNSSDFSQEIANVCPDVNITTGLAQTGITINILLQK